jgi:predicted SprT family Zn-dependent metalloprotease
LSSSRKNSQTWPHPRHARFEEMLHQSNAAWFAERGFNVEPRRPYLLEHREDWRKNILLHEVIQYIDAEMAQRREKRDSFPLHKYLHHGLSSQAICSTWSDCWQ